jgi:hypothetical protein
MAAARSASVAGRMSVGVRGAGVGVVDGGDLGDPFAVAFLALGQPGRQLRAGVRGGLRGGWAQRVVAHHHALAVAGQHQQISGPSGRWPPVRAERVEVGRGPGGEVLYLALAQVLPGDPLERVDRAVVGAAGCLDRGEFTQPVGVFLGGQVQQPVSGVQVRLAGFAVGQPGHRDRPEHGRQPAGVPGLGPGPGQSVGVEDLDPGLADLPEVQVVLQQLAQQRASLDVQAFLQLGVGQPAGLGAVQEPQHRLEPHPAGGEPGRLDLPRRAGCRGHRLPRAAPRRAISAARPASPAASRVARAAAYRSTAARTAATSPAGSITNRVRPPSE